MHRQPRVPLRRSLGRVPRGGSALLPLHLLAPPFLAAALLAGCAPQEGATPERQAEVAARGAEVMPFDLDRTHHRFEKAPGGGIQTVTANDPADTLTIRLVRAHLQEEAARFARGDFTDPGRVHGNAMPGLEALAASAGRVTVRYEEVPAGGRIHYAAPDAALVAALHAWFDAQVRDHGKHASAGGGEHDH